MILSHISSKILSIIGAALSLTMRARESCKLCKSPLSTLTQAFHRILLISRWWNSDAITFRRIKKRKKFSREKNNSPVIHFHFRWLSWITLLFILGQFSYQVATCIVVYRVFWGQYEITSSRNLFK